MLSLVHIVGSYFISFEDDLKQLVYNTDVMYIKTPAADSTIWIR
jgi:hypothetical protein